MNSASCYFSSTRFTAVIAGLTALFFLSLSIVSPARSEKPFFSISLSTFDNEQDAETEVARLKNSGHNAFYRQDTLSAKYEVYIEKYESIDEAEKEARVLHDLELISDYKVKEVGKKSEASVPPEKLETLPDKKEQETPEVTEKPETQKQEPEHKNKVAGHITKKPVEEKPASIEKSVKPPAPSPEIRKNKNRPEPAVTKKTPPKKSGNSSLQVGSFQDEKNAIELRNKLSSMGRKAFYREESVEGKGEFYRIYLTGYNSIGEAVKDAKSLVNSGAIQGYIRARDLEEGTSVTANKKEEHDIYFLHISSNELEETARKAVEMLKDQGYKAFYIPEKVSEKIWYRIYIGEFRNEAEARKKGAELRDNGVISYFKPIAIDRNKLEK